MVLSDFPAVVPFTRTGLDTWAAKLTRLEPKHYAYLNHIQQLITSGGMPYFDGYIGDTKYMIINSDAAAYLMVADLIEVR